jgi:acetyl esterase/lipase
MEKLIKNLERIPVLIWFHGGGFVFGSAFDRVNSRIAKRLAKNANIFVLSVYYSKAPDHKFPIAIEEAYSVLYQLFHNPPHWATSRGNFSHIPSFDFNKMMLGGVGSGANLAAVTMLLWSDRTLDAKGNIPSSQIPAMEGIHSHPPNVFHNETAGEIFRMILVHPDLLNYPDFNFLQAKTTLVSPEVIQEMRQMYLRSEVPASIGKNLPSELPKDPIFLQSLYPYINPAKHRLLPKYPTCLNLYNIKDGLFTVETGKFFVALMDAGVPIRQQTILHIYNGEIAIDERVPSIWDILHSDILADCTTWFIKQ